MIYLCMLTELFAIDTPDYLNLFVCVSGFGKGLFVCFRLKQFSQFKNFKFERQIDKWQVSHVPARVFLVPFFPRQNLSFQKKIA